MVMTEMEPSLCGGGGGWDFHGSEEWSRRKGKGGGNQGVDWKNSSASSSSSPSSLLVISRDLSLSLYLISVERKKERKQSSHGACGFSQLRFMWLIWTVPCVMYNNALV